MAKREDNIQARLERDLAELKLPEIARNYREVLDEAARNGTSLVEVLATLFGLEQTARQQRARQILVSELTFALNVNEEAAEGRLDQALGK